VRRSLAGIAILFIAFQLSAAQGTLPFTIELGAAMDIPKAPKLNSPAAAQSGGKWLFVGGRVAGLHTFKNATPQDPANNFPPFEMNYRAWVIDPVTQQVWSSALPADSGPFLAATNAEYEQDGDTLYVVGGYGLWPRSVPTAGQADNMRTFDTLTAIKVTAAIDAIVNGKPLAPLITQIHDARLRVTGGDLRKSGDWFYLVFGQLFDGIYTPGNAEAQTLFVQNYTEQIAVFKIASAPLAITDYKAIAATQLPVANGRPKSTDPAVDARPFHRRDLTLAPIMTAGAAPGLVARGGVFVPGQINAYRKPVYITGPTAGDVRIDAYQQFMSQYNTATVPMFSAASKTMYTTQLGGISLYYRFPPTLELKRDGGLPFIDEITTMTVTPDGKSSECIAMPTLPGFLGAGAVFFPSPGVARYENNVLRLDSIASRTLVGYMYGGILSSSPHSTHGEPTYASSMAIPIYVTPKPSPCTIAAEPVE
jgi:hypothetical protein